MAGISPLSRVGACELLTEFGARLDKLHKKMGDLSTHDPGESVVLAKAALPLHVWKLNPQSDKWLVKKDIPAFSDLQERLWWAKQEMRKAGFMSEVGSPGDVSMIPSGLRLWQPTDIAKELLPMARKQAFQLVKEEIALPIRKRLPFGDDRKLHGHYLVFGTRVGDKILYKDALHLLQARAPGLAQFVNEYAKLCMHLWGVDEDTYNEKTQLLIMRYEPGHGIWTHVDNVARYDRGPICTISLGPKHVYYDMYPSLVQEGKSQKGPVRLEFEEGVMASMDGRARMEWAHTLPEDAFPDEYKITVMLKSDKFCHNVVGYMENLKTQILETPVVGENNSSIRLPCVNNYTIYAPRCHVDEAAYQIHKRLQMLESRVLTQNYLVSQTLWLGCKDSSTESSSSSSDTEASSSSSSDTEASSSSSSDAEEASSSSDHNLDATSESD